MLTFSCKHPTGDSNPIDTLEADKNNPTVPGISAYNIYHSNGVTIDVKHENSNYVILSTIESQKRAYDLTKLNIPTKTPDEIMWANNEYACIMTWWSQAQCRCIFIPTKITNELIYLDKDIEETDSIHNNVVYLDSLLDNDNKVVFRVENLLTRKSKVLELSINEQNGIYPFYDQIVLTKNKLTMTTATEKKSVDIREINSGF